MLRVADELYRMTPTIDIRSETFCMTSRASPSSNFWSRFAGPLGAPQAAAVDSTAAAAA
jgi:hypothetical protein